MSQTYKNWIGDLFDGQVISFTDETKWQVEKKICEKCFYFCESSDWPEFSEASAVYHCRQVEGASVGKEAIMKVRLQVPVENPYDGRANCAILRPPEVAMQELVFLAHLTEMNCSAAPKLLSWAKYLQDENEFIPSGFMVFLVMEKVPGESLSNYECYPREEKPRIRDAFREAIIEVRSHGVYPGDERPHNLHWDSKAGKCYVLDYEIASYIEPGDDVWFGDMDLVHWGMAWYDNGGRTRLA